VGADEGRLGPIWPCVNDPAPGSPKCIALGEYSLLALVPSFAVMDSDSEAPIVVHLTVCRAHLRVARSWLARSAPDGVDTYRTELLMERWNQVKEELGDVEIFRVQSAA
jgi:hypothetical protein